MSKATTSKVTGSKFIGWLVAILAVTVMAVATAPARQQREFERVIARVMAMTEITAAPGYRAKILIPPGHVYDPLSAVPHGEGFLLNDDGGVEGDTGSRILAVDGNGVTEVVVGLGTLPPVVGFDVAPQGFGAYAGQLFVLGQRHTGLPGAGANHLVQRIEIGKGPPTTVCELPALGPDPNQKSSVGTQAVFGPPGSPFGNRLFTVTLGNNTIYQTTADGACTPFVTFDGETQGQPFYVTFTPDGRAMLVSLGAPLRLRPGAAAPKNTGRIARVGPDGKVADAYFATGMGRPAGMDFAPEGFGAFGGQLFVATAGGLEIPVPMTQQLKRDGAVIRIAPDGSRHPVADGFVNPMGIKFVHGRLIVNDINGDFIAGGREVPDGFVVEITPR